MAENTPEIKTTQEWVEEIEDLKKQAFDLHRELLESKRKYGQILARIKYCEEAIRRGGVSG